MGWSELISACALDRANAALWSEFLRRYGPKVIQFVRATLYLTLGTASPAHAAAELGGMQENDLFQSTIVRLVQNDCAAMRRFSGTTEYEWLAYLAIVTRSIIRDSLRRQRALKRPGRAEAMASPLDSLGPSPIRDHADHLAVERKLLAQELRSVCERAIRNLGGESSSRDLVIFRLHFEDGVSAHQIAQCKGVNLSKAGVEKVINRLKDRIRSAVSANASEAMMR